MKKIKRHIEIVSATAPGLSSMSQPSRQAIQQTLARHFHQVSITIVNNLNDLEALIEKSPDLVFLGMKFIPLKDGRKLWLADYLSERGIATTGSQSIAHRIELSKPLAKKCVLYAGLATSKYWVAAAHQALQANQLPSQYPLFVKPSDRGGGAGIGSDSIVHNFSQLQAKVAAISAKFNANSLIEKYLPGREFSVAILKNQHSPDHLAMPIELVAPSDSNGARILGSDVKSNDSEQVKPVSDSLLRQSLSDLAIGAFRAIGGRDYGRVDIRLDKRGRAHFLEANLIPSLIDNYGSFPKACELNHQLGYEDMLLQIVDLGLSRARTAPVAEALEKAKPLVPSGAALSGSLSSAKA